MSICRARLCNTSTALTFRMSGEQIRLQFLPKLLKNMDNSKNHNRLYYPPPYWHNVSVSWIISPFNFILLWQRHRRCMGIKRYCNTSVRLSVCPMPLGKKTARFKHMVTIRYTNTKPRTGSRTHTSATAWPCTTTESGQTAMTLKNYVVNISISKTEGTGYS